jgi:hypothetical protein
MTADLPSYRARFLHVTVIWAFGVTQPALAVVGGNPDLLLLHGASRLDLLLFALVVALGFPAVAVAYCWLVRRLSAWAGDVLYLVVVGTALAPLMARLVKPLDPGLIVATSQVGLLAATGVVLYALLRPVRLFVGYAVVLPIAAGVALAHGMPPLGEDAAASGVRVESRIPVVVIVLDELPVSSLLTRSGRIDAVRYPSFAKLARDATWYPNATTVHEWTADAVPAILTGQVGGSTLPVFDNHPENLFALLGDSYAMEVNEASTQLCPERYCPRDRATRTAILHRLALDASRLLIPRVLPDSFASRLLRVPRDTVLYEPAIPSVDRCKASIDELSSAGRADVLLYCHLDLPHVPWQFLPSGAWYDFRGLDGWFASEHWADEEWPVLQGYQRHLLQLGYTDLVLGRILRALHGADLYDRALVVLVSDHGVSFRAGEGRRKVTADNLVDIANVLLLVKQPGQHRSRVDRRAAPTIDVLPTIAHVLGIRLPRRVDGVSLVGRAPDERQILVDLRGGKVARPSVGEIARGRASLVRWKIKNFGQGDSSLYRIGTSRQLIGRAVDTVTRHYTPVAAEIENADQLASVRRSSGFLPVRIFGEVSSGSVGAGVELAVAVNGRIRALTRVFGPNQAFRAFVPETSLRDGANEVEVFLVRGRGDSLSLAPIASAG